jgi:hypothetical protein
MLKSRGPHCTNPTDDLGRILGVHVKEMAHRRPHRLFAGIIERHPNFAVKNFECWAVPILDDVVMGGKARVNEGAQVFTDCFAPVPIWLTQGSEIWLEAKLMISNRRHTLLGIAISLRAAITSLVMHDIQCCVLKFLVKMSLATTKITESDLKHMRFHSIL